MSRLEIDTLRDLATPHVRRVRSVLSQLVAVLMKNSLIIGHGMTIGYAMILVPRLTDNAPNELIQLNQNKASWFSALPTLTAFVGAILSGMLVERVERKRLMMFATITQLLSFLCFYFITELWQASIALTALGIVGGAMQVSALAYIAEVMEPRLRGILMATNIQALQLGLLIEYYIGSIFEWREAALVSCIAPVAAFCSSYVVPESPYWLLMQNKPEDARKSLAWLRGWTTVTNIEEEFQELQTGIGQKPAKVRRKLTDISIQIPAVKPPQLSTAKKYLKKDFLIPLVLVSSMHFVVNFSGPSTTPTAAKSFFLALDVPIDEHNATVMLGAAQFVGSSLYAFSVRHCGKKKTAIASATSVCLCNAILGAYSLFNQYSSPAATSLESSTEVEYKWVPFVLILVMACLGNCGFRNLPLILSGEIFSNDTRAAGCGLSMGVSYLSDFAAGLYLLKSAFKIHTMFWAYACISLIAVIVIAVGIPETEGQTVEEITSYFKDKCKLRNITKIKGLCFTESI